MTLKLPLSLTLMMSSLQVVETSVIDTNSRFQDYTHLDDHRQSSY